jgi:hypothetical protein
MPSKTSLKADRRAVRTLTLTVPDLAGMTVGGLQEAWKEVYGEPTRSRNKAYLRKKLQFRLQELQEGGRSTRAEEKADELAEEHGKVEESRRSSRKRSAEFRPTPAAGPRDPRLPRAGTKLKREYKGKAYQVTVHEQDFEYASKRYASLSTLAREITGQVWNGFLFFGLTKRPGKG